MGGCIFSRRKLDKAQTLFFLLELATLFFGEAGGNYSVIAPFVDTIPPKAAKFKQALDWNYDLRWNERLQWDVGHTACWDVNFREFYESSVHHKWESCRRTAVYLNSKLEKEKQHFNTGTCCYIKCALHWAGWVNDDYSFNEARGENIARDLMKHVKRSTFSRLMEEYRECSKLYKFPFNENCTDNLEFARCHIQAFNNMCDQQLNKRDPYPYPERIWTSTKEKSIPNDDDLEERSIKTERKTVATKPGGRSMASKDGGLVGRKPCSSTDLLGRSARAPDIQLEAEKDVTVDVPESSSNEVVTPKKRRAPWLTTGHFCTDLCQSACSINENLYADEIRLK